MTDALDVTVWDDTQVLCESPPESVGVRLWADVARVLIGDDTEAAVSIDCDDAETEAKLRVAGFRVAEIDPEAEVEDTVTLERSGRLGDLLDAVLRLPPEAPLGALATAEGKGVDFDLGVGLDVWGEGAAAALATAANGLGISLRERPPGD